MAQSIKRLLLGLVLAFAPALAFAQVALPKSSINNAQPVFCVNPSTMVTQLLFWLLGHGISPSIPSPLPAPQ